MNCLHIEIEFSRLSSRNLAALTIINLILMVGNVIANISVMYVLIKTKQMTNITCKLIFVLSTSDLMIGVFVQNLFMASFYERNCLLQKILRFFSLFLTHFSCYIIAILGIDRYIRIKYFTKFKTIWTKKVVLTLMCIAFCHALQLAVMAVIDSIMNSRVSFILYIAIEGIIAVIIVFLQIKTITISNKICATSNISTAERTNKKITRLSLRIMLLLCFFMAPQLLITNILKTKNQDQFSDSERSVLQVIYCLSVSLVFENSLANAILFLLMNVKARRYFRGFIR